MALKASGRVGAEQAEDTFDTPAQAPSPSDLSRFGLAPARFRLELVTADHDSVALEIGQKNSFNDTLYARRPNGSDVFLIPADFAFRVEQDLYKLRDKRALTAAKEDITRLTVMATSPGSPALKPRYTVQRTDKGFSLEAPLKANADMAEVEALLTALTSMRAQHFAAEADATEATAKALGFAAPSLTATLGLKDGQSMILLFTEHTEPQSPKRYFVRRAGPYPILELGNDWALKKLNVTAHELRDRRVWTVDREQITKLTLTKVGHPPLSFTKEAKEKWRSRKRCSMA